jgi:hypothetical protein
MTLMVLTRPRLTLFAYSTDDESPEMLAAYVIERGRKTHLTIEKPAAALKVTLYLGGSPFGGKAHKKPQALLWLEEGRKLAVLFDTESVLVLQMPAEGFPDRRYLSENAGYARGEELAQIVQKSGL